MKYPLPEASPRIVDFGAIRAHGVRLEIIVVHDSDHVVQPIEQGASDIGKIVALLNEVDRPDGAVS